MEQTFTKPSFTFSAKSYSLLTKPGIILGNVFTTAGGFCLASRGVFDAVLFLWTLLGISLIIGCGCVLNNYLDVEADKKMNRTKNRPLVKGEISKKGSLIFALFLGVLGIASLITYVNLFALSIALFGLFVYVVLYTLSKYYSVHGTLIGSVAGAVPPLVGYVAVTNALDLGAFLFFLLMVFWQMPHFFAIAICQIKDYERASIPILPLKEGMRKTKIQMLYYLMAFLVTSSLLYITGYLGLFYLLVLLVTGARWLWLAIEGFRCKSDHLWAKKMFSFSLVVIMALCFSIPFSVL